MTINLFISCEEQIANLRAWNMIRELGLRIEEAALENLHPFPSWPTGDLNALVLTPYLADLNGVNGLRRTFEFLWTVALRQQPKWKRNPDLVSEFPRLSLVKGEGHVTGLQWHRVDLGLISSPPKGIRRQPHASILAAAAHFPHWVRWLGCQERRGILLPGYRFDTKGGYPWESGIPYLAWDQSELAIVLDIVAPDSTSCFFWPSQRDETEAC